MKKKLLLLLSKKKTSALEKLILKQSERRQKLAQINQKIDELDEKKDKIESIMSNLEESSKAVINKAKSYLKSEDDKKLREGYDLINEVDIKMSALKIQFDTISNILIPLKEKKIELTKLIKENQIEIESLKVSHACTSVTKDVYELLKEVQVEDFDFSTIKKEASESQIKEVLKLQSLEKDPKLESFEETVDYKDWLEKLKNKED